MDFKKMIKNKRSQITIFIIIAIIIVALILILFFVASKGIKLIKKPSLEIEDYIRKCTKDATNEAVDIILSQGGYIQPENYIMYDDNKVAYICYNKNYYQTCINQIPVYIEHLEKEIENYIKPKIEDCFFSLEQEYEKRGYAIETSALNLDVNLFPSQIKININKKFDVTNNEETKRFEKFNFVIQSSIFELANVAREIVNQESKYCNFEYLGYMLFYPQFSIDKKSIGAGETASKIYIIGDRITNKKLYIAIRSCAIPPGF